MRIGVVSDTHVGEQLATLPREVLERLEGERVDLILHAGDVSVPQVLDELREVAPVAAVRGNHDGRSLGALPRDLVVPSGGHRIGLTHGSRTARVELPSGLVSLAAGHPVLLGFDRTMAGRFRDVEMVVVGHLHMPIDRWVGGVRLFSPGAVYVPELGAASEPGGFSGWAYRRYRSSLSAEDKRPAIGLITAGPEGLQPRRIVLERPVEVSRRPRRR